MTREQYERWMKDLDVIANEMGCAVAARDNPVLRLALGLLDGALDRLDEAATVHELQ